MLFASYLPPRDSQVAGQALSQAKGWRPVACSFCLLCGWCQKQLYRQCATTPTVTAKAKEGDPALERHGNAWLPHSLHGDIKTTISPEGYAVLKVPAAARSASLEALKKTTPALRS